MFWMPEELRLELRFYLEEEKQTGRTRNVRGLPCLWYDPEKKGCRHYRLRPQPCRDAEVGGSSCLFWLDRLTPQQGRG